MAISDKDLFKRIRRIQIETTHLADDILAGAYKSAFKGKGLEFEELREYQEGDDIRLIDWNKTQNMGHPFVKVFREERDITVMLIVDISSSSRFGSVTDSKSAIIAEIGAIIAFSAIKNNDKVGLVLFSDEVELYVPPRKGTRHVLRIIRELLAFQPKHQGTNLNKALNFVGNVLSRSAVCFVISDFIAPDYTKEMKLMAKKNDLITISVTDPHEINFPDVGLVELRDLETGLNALIDSSEFQFRESLKKKAEDRLEAHRKLMAKINAGYIAIRTDEPYLMPIRKFFKMRGRKRR